MGYPCWRSALLSFLTFLSLLFPLQVSALGAHTSDPNTVGVPYTVTWTRSSSDPESFYIQTHEVAPDAPPLPASDTLLVHSNGATEGTVTFTECNNQRRNFRFFDATNINNMIAEDNTQYAVNFADGADPNAPCTPTSAVESPAQPNKGSTGSGDSNTNTKTVTAIKSVTSTQVVVNPSPGPADPTNDSKSKEVSSTSNDGSHLSTSSGNPSSTLSGPTASSVHESQTAAAGGIAGTSNTQTSLPTSSDNTTSLQTSQTPSESPTAATKSVPVVAILLPILAVLAFLLLGLFALFGVRRRRARRRKEQSAKAFNVMMKHQEAFGRNPDVDTNRVSAPAPPRSEQIFTPLSSSTSATDASASNTISPIILQHLQSLEQRIGTTIIQTHGEIADLRGMLAGFQPVPPPEYVPRSRPPSDAEA